MPEGDSIFKVAARLRPALVGRSLARFELRDRGPISSLVGRAIEKIDVHGKNMFVHIESRWVLHVHLGMKGSWRAFPNGIDRMFPRASALAVLGVDRDVHVCFRAAKARLSRIDDPVLRRIVEQLGPDVLDPEFALERAVARSLAQRGRAVAEVITDQRVVAGIGNVYKSEVLFVCGLHPRTPSERVSATQWTELYTQAVTLMRANLIPGRRTTTATHKAGRHPAGVEPFWVYRRRAAPCLRCKTPVQRDELGDLARSTYWCPRCQPWDPADED